MPWFPSLVLANRFGRCDVPRHFTATLVAADDDGIDLDQDDRRVRIDYSAIRRGRLVFDSWGGRS